MLERGFPEVFTDPDAQALRDSVRYQAEHFDDTPAVIAACYSQPPRPDPRDLVEVLRAVGPRFLTRVANPRLAAVQGAASSYPVYRICCFQRERSDWPRTCRPGICGHKRTSSGYSACPSRRRSTLSSRSAGQQAGSDQCDAGQ
jgi:hypothetical protein